MLGRFDRWSFSHREPDGWRWTRYAQVGAAEGASGELQVVGRSSESYHNQADCEANARRLGWTRTSWPVSRTPDRWTFYRDRGGRWRWRRQALNNRIVGASHRGWEARGDCERNACRFGWRRGPCSELASTGDWGPCGDAGAGA